MPPTRRSTVATAGYHDFCLRAAGAEAHRSTQGEALLDSARDALEKSALFVKGKLKQATRRSQATTPRFNSPLALPSSQNFGR